MLRRLSWGEVWRERLRRHHLSAPAPPERLADVVGEVCGIHAQVAASAELSLGLRVAGLTASDVRSALWHTRSLVKTYGVRGTLHLLPSHEIGLWLAALRSVPPRPRPASSPPPISAEQRVEIVHAMREALDGRQLTRDELGQALADLLGGWVDTPAFQAFGSVWRPWQVALSTAAHQGVVCFGPPLGTRVTYVRLDQWLPAIPTQATSPDGQAALSQATQPDGQAARRQATPPDGQAALREVVRRYVAAYGPTTHVELARWLATPPAAARAVLHSLEDLEPVEVEGWPAFVLADPPGATATPAARRSTAPTPDADPSPAPAVSRAASQADCGQPLVHLLPHFDPYVVGCHPRAQLIPPAAPPALHTGTAATFAVLLLDGVVGGVWQRHSRGSTLELVVDPFASLSHAQQSSLDQQAHRLGEILGLEPKLSLGHVEPRAHL